MTKEQLIVDLKNSMKEYSKDDMSKVLKAYEFADKYHKDQKRASGEEFITHPLSIGIRLANMNVDHDMIIAGILHDLVEDTEVSLEDIEKIFGANIAELVDGVTKISKLKPESKKTQKAETIRKMLFAMIKDMKIIIIKFVDKLHNMSTLNYLPVEKRKIISLETLEIYAPLAGKMGVHVIKDELEDYALRWIYPDVYKIIKSYFDKNHKEMERTTMYVSGILSKKLNDLEIPFKIKSRTKHYYSIYKKMKKYNKRIDEIFDLYGIRIITDNVTNCYQIFGVIHNLWQPITGRFRDFIAHPKKNGYRSLHTTVLLERRKAVEIQIRTEEMNEINEYGVAAHWYYKKGHQPDPNQLRWLGKLMEVHKESLSSEEYYQTIRDDILKDEMYVFTPKGDIVELPKGATPLDYAYKIHTEIGHRCKGAKANGIIVPLNSPLKNGMVIEVITGKVSQPKQQWLSIVKTSHARKKIKSWFASHREQDIVSQKLAEKKETKKKQIPEKKMIKEKISNAAKITIEVNGEKNFLYYLAKCCNPNPYDAITGFISRGRGVIIHRKDCHNLKYIKEIDKRTIDVEWVMHTKNKVFSFFVRAQKDSSPYFEVGNVINKYHGNIIKWDVEKELIGKDSIEGVFSVEFSNSKNIPVILKEIRKIPSIYFIDKR